MAMDFWAAQRRAKSKTTLYLTIFIVLTLGVALLAEYTMRVVVPDDYNSPFPIIGIVFLLITFSVSGFEYVKYMSFGGAYVAKMVGGRLANEESPDLRERQLINIVQEMALAASLPIPPIYIIDQSKEINAFAAGTTSTNAAITVTRGCLDSLNRDELQGVIAHEFGHVYNGDMKISMRLAAMVMGFFFVLYFALRIIQFSSYGERNSRDKKNGGNVIMVAALILFVSGILTWFFGSVLKACVSREREYLADACAVQFTRNPDGISNALRKIDNESFHDMPSKGMAFSHLYIDNYTGINSLFATHPSIKKRLEAIEGKTYYPPSKKQEDL